MIDNRTPEYSLPQPHPDNRLEEDVVRLRDALNAIDAALKTLERALATKSNASTVTALGNSLGQSITGLTERMVQVESSKVSQVNGQAGPSVQLTPAHLGLLPNQPTDGPTAGTLTRDAAGVLTGVSFTVDEQETAVSINRDGHGRIASVVTTRGGKQRTVTLARDAQGRIAAFTGARTDV